VQAVKFPVEAVKNAYRGHRPRESVKVFIKSVKAFVEAIRVLTEAVRIRAEAVLRTGMPIERKSTKPMQNDGIAAYTEGWTTI
jgi:hypothetical protein